MPTLQELLSSRGPLSPQRGPASCPWATPKGCPHPRTPRAICLEWYHRRKETQLRSGLTSQCSGTSPSHSTPEGLRRGDGSSPAVRAASGGRPRVTVRVMSAVRHSCSRSMNSRIFATSASVRSVSRSRNAVIARCSSRGGSRNAVERTESKSRLSTVAPCCRHSVTARTAARESSRRSRVRRRTLGRE